MINDTWPLMAQAPVVFAGMALLVAAFGFSAGRYFKSEEISNLKSRLAQRDDLVADYKQKLSGATPDQAQSKIHELEMRLAALEPKILSDQEMKLIFAIASGSAGRVQIMLDMATSDLFQFKRQLSECLSAAGWEVQGGSVIGLNTLSPSGIIISSDTGSVDTPEAKILSRAFDTIGLKHEAVIGPDRSIHGTDQIKTSITITRPVP